MSVLIRDILPEAFHGIQKLYEQAHEPDGREVLQYLRAQIREKGIERRGKLLDNSRQFSAFLGNSGLWQTAAIMLCKLLEIPVGRGCVLMLYPSELRQGLSMEYWEKGLRRGERIMRYRQQQKRQRGGC